MTEYIQAVRALESVVSEARHLDECFSGETSPLAKQISYGACRNFFLYEELAALLMDKPLPDKHLDLKLLIIAGLYSIDHLHRPAHASVNRVVDTTRTLKKAWAKGMVNAVLRRYGREKNQLRENISEQGRLNHPNWLIQLIRQDWPDNPNIFACNNQQAPMSVRVNTTRTSVDDYLRTLSNAGIEARQSNIAESGVVLKKAIPAGTLPGFDNGMVSIQDEAPQLAPHLLNLYEGAQVLDACAAPGGKTCHLLEFKPHIIVTAIDRDRKRVPLIHDNLNRLALNAEVIAIDLESYNPERKFDRILLDAPCSATGIIRRHPDIKLLRNDDDIAKLASIQRRLLDKAFNLLANDGELLYSTCSILRQENDEVISDFLARTPDAALKPLPIEQRLINEQGAFLKTPFGLQLLPTMDSHDGFFYASIRRVTS